jgi:RNA polymerase sigma-70 factor (ECF subfamily)
VQETILLCEDAMADESAADRRRRFVAEALPHIDALYGTALRLTRNPSDAEDLVQETYLKAHRFWDRYKPGTNCKAWLYKILTNTRINQYVKTSRRPVQVNFEDVEPLLEQQEARGLQTTTNGQLELFASLLDDEFKAAMEAVPEDFRIVLILAGLEGFSYKEIAEILDIPIGTVMSRLFRARRLLQTELLTYARNRGLVQD